MKNTILINTDHNTLFISNMKLLTNIDDFISLCRTQQYNKVINAAPGLLCDIDATTNLLIQNQKYFNQQYDIINNEFLQTMLSEIKSSFELQDYVLLADLCEVQVMPLIKDFQTILIPDIDIYSTDTYLIQNLELLELTNKPLAMLIKNHKYDQQIYKLEYSDIGAISLSIINNSTPYNISTMQNPFEDGKMLAQTYYEANKNHYVIYGFGMGYHLIEMSKLYKDSTLDIYESDLSILKIAFKYTDLTELLESRRISIHYDSHFTKLSMQLKNINQEKKQSCFIVHYPSIHNIKLLTIKTWMEDLFAKYNKLRNEQPKLASNFKSNIHHHDDTVDNLKDMFKQKILFIVAAGPSLDKNVHLLKKVPREKCIILAVGTIFKKLLNLNIIPDYFIVSDPNTSVYRQIDGIEDIKVPMLLLSTALSRFGTNYKGKKYIICQNEFDLAEDFAAKMGYSLYNTGGSVSTVALDIGVQLGCKKIIFLGLDLGYTNGYAHSTDSSMRVIGNTDYMQQVKAVDGGMVSATKSFIWYREWIENRIKETANVEFIDATEGGAYIEGTTVMTLLEVLSSLNV